MIDEEVIEAAVITTITEGLDYLPGPALAYAGELDMIEAAVPVPAPAVRAYLGGFERSTVTNAGLSGSLSVGVLVITAAYSDPALALERLGEHGAHRICRDVVQLLDGNDLGIDGLQPLLFLRKRMSKRTADRTAYLLEFTTFNEVTL